MYKIYINETPLIFIDTSTNPQPKVSEDELIAYYPGKKKFLLNYIDMLEKVQKFKHITLYSANLEQLYRDFLSHYKVMEAAGGLVFNSLEELLVIYRRGSWDLPKGKIDPGERKEEAAIREVMEETGVDQLQLGDYLGASYHTYKNQKGQRVLKLTHWFEMATKQQALKPQTEEDIEVAKWEDPQTFLNSNKVIYNSIKDIVKKWQNVNKL